MAPRRVFSPVFALLLALLGAAPMAAAQVLSGNSYPVGGVEVDVTAANAVEARDQAIREARRRAGRMLVERLVPPEDRAKVPTLDDQRLEGMVRGVEFARERPVGNRYIATLTVVFAVEPVKAWLGEAGIRVVETVARAALVVPLWKARGGLEALDDRNAWREAWRGVDSAASAVPLLLLRGDQLDQDAATSEELFVGDVTALSRLNERYRAPTVLVVAVEGDKAGGALSVAGFRYDAQTGARGEIARLAVPSPDRLGEAAKQIHARLEEEWRPLATVRRDTEEALDVSVPIADLADWVRVRQRLGGVPAIRRVNVRTLETHRADLRLEFFGTPDELQRVLAQAGLSLVKEGEGWQLRAR